MTEAAEQPVSQEVQTESKIVNSFRDVREKELQESQEIGEIYRAMKKPGGKDVYNAWVKNMDVVANSYSWGKDKVAVRTRLLKVANRIVGGVATAVSVPADLIIDVLSWPIRHTPFIGRIIPTNLAKQYNLRMAESAKNEALILRGVTKVVNVPGEAIGELVRRQSLDALHIQKPERRAANLAAKILYPNKI